MSKKSKKNQKKNKKPSTQEYLDISEIRDDTVVMRDGTIRAVLLVSSINFALKSEEEQNALISAYVGFLNNLDFPAQIIVQSRRFNIEQYLNDLEEKEKEQTNELLKMQTKEYIQYVKELIDMCNIMSKRFYLAIPYNPLSDKHKSFLASLTDTLKPSNLVRMKKERFKRYKNELDLRVDSVLSSLGSIGLKAVKMDTQSLIELFYNTYNPDTSEHEKMTETENIRVQK
jgi:hypothetical protein